MRGSIRRSVSSWRASSADVFGRSGREEDDEEALKWAALEKLPTYDRMRKGIMTGEAGDKQEVDIQDLGMQDRKKLLERLVRTAEEDNERFLLKLRNRMESWHRQPNDRGQAISVEGQESVITDYILKVNSSEKNQTQGQEEEQTHRVKAPLMVCVAGEMLVGPAKALFMDEISTGLDSSTTYQIVNSLRQSVHILGGTALIALLQPAPETYDLFDDIVLLSEGQIVYQGPRENVLEFFETMGFRCPERKGAADFLQEVTSRKDQHQYWSIEGEPYRYVSVNEFAEAFQSFHVGRKLGEELSVPFDRKRNHPAALTTTKYGISMTELLKACISREWLLMKRNSFVYIFKVVQVSNRIAMMTTPRFS
ncbi:hypothetical protein BHE74_00018806 [Ensete ventricosum]|nr:hypothetical protein GW17_00003773 [Ensete ventricosum]RWW73324.1 hypothetical protein BHE74_00018806 [Ensete ventricosum]RZR79480.1 hypothetical protein BHM03_00005209 [Ensete ventricosum]